jgi:hypothetical protein
VPRGRKGRYVDDVGFGALREVIVANKQRLVVDSQRSVDDAAQVRRFQMHLGARGIVPLLQPSQAGVEFHAAGQGGVDDLVRVHPLGLRPARGALGEVLLDVVTDDLVDRPEVLFHVGDLLRHASHEP